MFEIILKDFAWASLLLLIGLFLRSKVTIFQKLFIPVAVIAGLVGLLLSSEVLGKFCPYYIHWSDNVSGFANPLLAILFVTQFIALSFNSKMIKKCSLIFFISATVIGAQVLSAMAMGRLFHLPDGAALLPFGAFYGAHGIPQVIADPELETDAGQNLITATPLWQISTQNFFLTIAPYFIVTAAGFRNLALGSAAMVVVALALGFIIGRK